MRDWRPLLFLRDGRDACRDVWKDYDCRPTNRSRKGVTFSFNHASAQSNRYLRRYLQISMKVSAQYHYYLLEAQLPCLRRRTQIARSPRTHRVRCVRRVRCDCVAARRRRCHVVIRHHRRPAPPPPAGRRRRFRGGAGECRCCHRHSRSCSPRRQGDARRRRRQDGVRRQALPDHHPPCPSPLATLS